MRWRDFGRNLTVVVLVAAGVIVLTGRRMLVPRVRTTSSPVDCLALILLPAIGGGHTSPLFYYPYRVNLGRDKGAAMTTTAAASRTYVSEPEVECTGTTLADEHEDLLTGVQRRVDAVVAVIDARSWPHSELATLTGFLRATLLRQVSDEEHLLYPHNATAAPFAELGAAHARLYELTHQLEEIRERGCPLPQLRALVDELLATLRRHLAEEEAVLTALAGTDLDIPSAATLSDQHQHWPACADDGPLVIQFDALPTRMASRICLERLLRLRPGDQAVIYSRDRTNLHDVCAWLHEFDAARFGFAISTDRHGSTRLEVSCRDPR